MSKRPKALFDPKIFLAKAGEGKRYPNTARIKLSSHRVRLRTRFFTSSKARSSSLSFPSKARKRSLRSWGPASFLAKDA